MPAYPCSISDFMSFFARDFNYAPADDPTNLDLIQPADISRAIAEANINFNPELFADPSIPYLYLVAFHLVADLQNSAKGISSQSKFPISSNSVGNVSITFQIPDKFAKNAVIQQYAQNGYGKKYLEFALPGLVGVSAGAFRQTSFR